MDELSIPTALIEEISKQIAKQLEKPFQDLSRQSEAILHFFKIAETPLIDTHKYADKVVAKYNRKINAKMESGS